MLSTISDGYMDGFHCTNRGSYMSDSVILKLVHELLENNKKTSLGEFFISFLTTNVLIAILHYHEC